MIRYVYLTCSKKLTDSQLSLPHEINKNCKTKTKLMSVISLVQSCDHEAVQSNGYESYEGFVEKVGFEPGMKE